MTDKEKIRAEIERLKENVGIGLDAYDMGEENGKFEAYEKVLAIIDSLPEEPASNDLEKAAEQYAKFTSAPPTDVTYHFRSGALWMEEHLWKDAQGDDLPEYDREVIVLCECHDGYKVCYGHRPYPKGWYGINTITKTNEHFKVQTYGKRGWSIPDAKWWLDLSLPYEGKEGEE